MYSQAWKLHIGTTFLLATYTYMGEDPLAAAKFPEKLDNFPFQPAGSKLSGKKCVWDKEKLSTYYLMCLVQAKNSLWA